MLHSQSGSLSFRFAGYAKAIEGKYKAQHRSDSGAPSRGLATPHRFQAAGKTHKLGDDEPLKYRKKVIVIVKPFFKLPHIRAGLTIALAAAILSGCGQRGPLYLPGQPAAPTAHTKPAPVDSNSSNSK
jgi:predicted small lipoprotein YifL